MYVPVGQYRPGSVKKYCIQYTKELLLTVWTIPIPRMVSAGMSVPQDISCGVHLREAYEYGEGFI